MYHRRVPELCIINNILVFFSSTLVIGLGFRVITQREVYVHKTRSLFWLGIIYVIGLVGLNVIYILEFVCLFMERQPIRV